MGVTFLVAHKNERQISLKTKEFWRNAWHETFVRQTYVRRTGVRSYGIWYRTYVRLQHL